MTKTIHAECCGCPDTHTTHLRRRRYYFEWIKNEASTKNFEGGPMSVKTVVYSPTAFETPSTLGCLIRYADANVSRSTAMGFVWP